MPPLSPVISGSEPPTTETSNETQVLAVAAGIGHGNAEESDATHSSDLNTSTSGQSSDNSLPRRVGLASRNTASSSSAPMYVEAPKAKKKAKARPKPQPVPDPVVTMINAGRGILPTPSGPPIAYGNSVPQVISPVISSARTPDPQKRTAEKECEVCGKFADVPYRFCSKCKVAPSWHHGGCCLSASLGPQVQNMPSVRDDPDYVLVPEAVQEPPCSAPAEGVVKTLLPPPGLDQTVEFEVKPYPNIRRDPLPLEFTTEFETLQSDPLTLERMMPSRTQFDAESLKKAPSESGSFSSAYGPAPRSFGVKSPYARSETSDANEVKEPTPSPNDLKITQHAINNADLANIRSQQAFDHSVQVAEHVGVQVAAMAALGSAVGETAGAQTATQQRVQRLEASTASKQQLQSVHGVMSQVHCVSIRNQ